MTEDKGDGIVLMIIVIIFCVFCIGYVGYIISSPSELDRDLINSYNIEYSKCISELPRNKDCKLTGFIFNETTK